MDKLLRSKFLNRELGPDFSKLSGIMERFSQVPYDQFQKELNDWFHQNLSNKDLSIDVDKLSDYSKDIQTLVNTVFENAEMLQKDQLSRSKSNKVLS